MRYERLLLLFTTSTFVCPFVGNGKAKKSNAVPVDTAKERYCRSFDPRERETGAGVVKEGQKENPTVRQDEANRLVCALAACFFDP